MLEYYPDAWYDDKKSKVGYEINFTQYFYVYEPPRPLEEIEQEQLEEKLIGLSQEEIYRSWGEPDGHLSGFWGEIWQLASEKSKHVTVYYDENGIVEHVMVKDLSE